VPAKTVALLLVLVSPKIMVPAPVPPKASVTVPSAVPELMVNPPENVLAWLNTAVPLYTADPPETPSVTPPVPDHTPVWAKLPLPVKVPIKFPEVAPSVNDAVAAFELTILKVALPVSVVVPKAKPAVPLVTLTPAMMLSV